MDLSTPTTKIEQLIQLSHEYANRGTVLVKGKIKQQLLDLYKKSKNYKENKNEQRSL